MHVLQAPGVGGKAAHIGGLPAIRPLGAIAIGGAGVVVGQFRGERFAAVEGGGGARSAGVLPLGLARQAIPLPCAAAQAAAELHRRMPAHPLHGAIRALEPGWIGIQIPLHLLPTRHLLPLGLADRRLAQEELPQLHLMLRAFVVPPLLLLRWRAHLEGSGRDPQHRDRHPRRQLLLVALHLHRLRLHLPAIALLHQPAVADLNGRQRTTLLSWSGGAGGRNLSRRLFSPCVGLPGVNADCQPPMQPRHILTPQLETVLEQGQILPVQRRKGCTVAGQGGHHRLQRLPVAPQFVVVVAAGLQHLGLDPLRLRWRQTQFPLQVVEQDASGRRDGTMALLGQLLQLLAVGHRGIAGDPAHHDAVAGAGGVELRGLGRIHLAEAPFPIVMQVLGVHQAPLQPIGRAGADAFHQKAGVGRQVLAAAGGDPPPRPHPPLTVRWPPRR